MFGASLGRVENNYQWQDRTQAKQQERRKGLYGSLQNGDITQFYFEKVKKLQLSLSLTITINLYLVVLAVLQQQLQTYQQSPDPTDEQSQLLEKCLYFSLICVGVAIILLSMRTLNLLQLQKQQKQMYQNATLFSSMRIISLLAESFILLLQPYPFFIGMHFSTQNAYQGYSINYPLNDILAIFSLVRVYILFRSALALTPYMTNRLCKLYGCRADYSYALKCLFKQHPVKLICICYVISDMIFAYLVYLAERQVLNPGLGNRQCLCINYGNSLWLILMTTTTVGYGDYFPQTPLGRIIILFVPIWGTLNVSIMLVVVTNTLSMEKSQIRTAKILDKLQLRSQIQQKARRLIGYYILSKYSRHKKHKKIFMREAIHAKKQFQNIRRQMKLMVEYNDLQDQLATHFLKLNNDVQTLNNNQDIILEFIHNSFNSDPTKVSEEIPSSQNLIEHYSEKQMNEEQLEEEIVFMDIFRNKMKELREQMKQKQD